MSEQAPVESSADPCAEFGPAQKAALVWFIAVILLGIPLVVTLCGIDTKMYAAKGRFLDFETYKENRMAFTSIGSENFDERAQGGYSVAAAEVTARSKK